LVVEDRSFEDFYSQEYRQVLALAFVLTGDRVAAEDVTHDGFMAALEAWGDLENPAGWIRTVVVNKAKSAWRRRSAESRALARMDAEVQVGDQLAEDTDEFWAEVRRLPRRQAQAIALFYLEDRPVAEIAELLGCEESTARVHLMRGRRSLARRLEVEDE
jgi:RNA polymerase sigma-70 factor (ECF subfamily)